MKKWFPILITILVLLFCVNSLAEEGPQVISATEHGTVDLVSPAKLANGYISHILKQNGTVSRDPRPFGNRLTGREKKLYDYLSDKIVKIATGQLASTEFEISADQIFEQETYTFAELGCTTAGEASKILQNSRNVLDALMQDYPYEMYWYDKTTGSGSSLSAYSDANSITPVKMTYKMAVSSNYQNGGLYVMNTTYGTSAAAAATNAQAIITKYHGQSNLSKLDGYRKEICDLVSYNDAAAAGGVSYGNPWQLIWVFDGDDTTKVVCEGYSKAFKYLCDNTSFAGGISVVCVNGTMDGGNHMWNLVKMTDGKNYMADITNCDEGTIGYPDKLFLCGYTSGDAESGYIYTANGHGIKYVYAGDISSLFLAGELDAADSAYAGADPVLGPALPVPTVNAADYVMHGADLPMTLSGEGIEYGIVSITDQNGNQVFHQQIDGTSITVPTSPLDNGTYTIHVQAGSSTNEPSDPATVTITINNIGEDPAATVTASLKVVWDDQDDFDGIRPKTLEYLLNGAQVTPVVTNWTAVMENLPKYENEALISYNWTIELPAGYEMTDSQVSGYDVTVTLTHRHAHNYQATYNWSEDGSACSVTLTCEKGDDTVTQDATVTSEVTQAATCSAAGVRTFTATLVYGGKTYTDTTTRPIEMLAHTTGISKPGYPATCTAEGRTDEIGCSVCHQVIQEQTVIPALGHDLAHHEAQAPTCTAVGWDAYDTCSRCDYTTYAEKPALGHAYVASFTWNGTSACTVTLTCEHDPAHTAIVEATITSAVTTQPTATTPGIITYTATATYEGTTYTDTKTEEIPPATPTIGDIFESSDGLKYKITKKNEVSLIGLVKASSKAKVIIPSTVSYAGTTYKVTDVAAKALNKDTKVATLEIGKNVKTIGKNAFASCTKLKTVKGGAAVTTIEDSAFSGDKVLKTFPILKKLQKIGANAFKKCAKMTQFTLWSKVNAIGKNAFNGCGALKTITVKTTKLNDKNVGAAAFKGINKNATFKCPKKKLDEYRKLFLKKGAPKTCKFVVGKDLDKE